MATGIPCKVGPMRNGLPDGVVPQGAGHSERAQPRGGGQRLRTPDRRSPSEGRNFDVVIRSALLIALLPLLLLRAAIAALLIAAVAADPLAERVLAEVALRVILIQALHRRRHDFRRLGFGAIVLCGQLPSSFVEVIGLVDDLVDKEGVLAVLGLVGEVGVLPRGGCCDH
eukprot:12380809-Alexandrium_andersonii.AAC.1